MGALQCMSYIFEVMITRFKEQCLQQNEHDVIVFRVSDYIPKVWFICVQNLERDVSLFNQEITVICNL